MRYLSGTSEDAIRCPKVFDGEDDTIVVQGAVVQDPAVTGVNLPDDGEGGGPHTPLGVRDGRAQTAGRGSVVTLEELFDTFTDSLFRLETLPDYPTSEYDERQRACRDGRLLPPPPVKVEWLTLVRNRTAHGRRIHRVHVLDQPLSDYLRYELAVYRENVAAGEDVRIADHDRHPDLADLRQDFLLIDGDTGHAAVLWFHHSPTGQLLGHRLSRDPGDISHCRRQRDLALAHSASLDEFTSGARAS